MCRANETYVFARRSVDRSTIIACDTDKRSATTHSFSVIHTMKIMSMDTINKKPRLMDITVYQFDSIFRYVGCLNACKCVKRGFLRLDLITKVKFDPQSSITTIFSVLSNRKNLKSIDFTDSVLLNEDIVHIVMMMHPSLKRLILDNCDNLEDFPTLDDTRELWTPILWRNGTMKWKEAPGPLISLYGNWRIYRKCHQQNPSVIASLLMRALLVNTPRAFCKVRSFCYDRLSWTSCFEEGIIDRLGTLELFFWTTKYEKIQGTKAFVIIDLWSDSFCCLLVWEFQMKQRFGRNIWYLTKMGQSNIEIMWRRLKYWV